MSLDYPNRANWLRIRCTGSPAQFRRQHPPKVLHVSKRLSSVRSAGLHASSLVEVIVPRGGGSTFRRPKA